MMGRSHEPAAVAGWLGCCLALNVAGSAVGHGPVMNPAVALVGAVVVDSFAAGKNSPDVDLWIPFLRHRGPTHGMGTLRVLTALSVTLVAGLWVMGWLPPFGLGWLVMAPVSGWWWHVAADRGWSKLGFRTGGLVESGRTKGRTVRVWIFRFRLKPRRVLPVAPATLGLEVLAVVMAVLVMGQWIRGFGGA